MWRLRLGADPSVNYREPIALGLYNGALRQFDASAGSGASREPTTPATPQPDPTSPPALPQAEDEIASVTPGFLHGLYQKHTTAQADALMHAYVGKRIRVSGTVGDVNRVTESRYHVTLKGSLGEPMIVLLFTEPTSLQHVSVLSRGDQLGATGVIDNVDGLTVRLTECRWERGGSSS